MRRGAGFTPRPSAFGPGRSVAGPQRAAGPGVLLSPAPTARGLYAAPTSLFKAGRRWSLPRISAAGPGSGRAQGRAARRAPPLNRPRLAGEVDDGGRPRRRAGRVSTGSRPPCLLACAGLLLEHARLLDAEGGTQGHIP